MRGFGTHRMICDSRAPHPLPLPSGEREELAARALPNVLSRGKQSESSGTYDAPASDMHFLVKLVCAAPCRFCALAWSAQHFLAKLFKAAPCRLLPVA